MSSSLNQYFLRPRSIAVMGASGDISKTRGKILHCLKQAGFLGSVYPVNPTGYKTIQGLTAYASLDELPEVPDLLLVGVPGAAVPQLLEDAAKRGCAGAIVFSSDVDPDSMARAIEVAHEHGMNVLGPNTEGFYFPKAGLAATFAQVVETCTASPSPTRSSRRPIAIVSQSGGIGFALFGRAFAENLDLHSVITTGNESDVDVLDFIEQLLTDDEIGVILLFIEGLKNARRFAAVANMAAERQVPIVVMKIGSSDAGQRAAISHTAHLAGADTAYDAMFERYGIIRVYDAEEMLAAGAALSVMPFITGERTAVVTTSGGAGGWAADLFSAYGLSLPALSDELQKRLMAHMVSYASPGNPVDTTVAAVEDNCRGMLGVIETLAQTDEVDAIVINMGLSAPGRIPAMAPQLRNLLEQYDVPILFHSHILPLPENLKALAEIGTHGFPSFRACASGINALRRYGTFQKRFKNTSTSKRRTSTASPLLAAANLSTENVLAPGETTSLLSHYRIPIAPSVIAADVASAAEAANAMGFPVVLKIQSPDISHKTEVGGVDLNVSAEALPQAYEQVLRNARQHAPDARIEGVQVQKMMPPGLELVVGTVTDPDFGPLIMLGAGGIYVEILKDVVFAPPPITTDDAFRMINSLKVTPILQGARGKPQADLNALADFLVAVAELALDGEGLIDQMDFNPVLVYPKAQGVVAVDALIAVVRND